MVPNENYQTRSEENGIVFFETMKEALDAALIDGSIWKISFWSASQERIRLVRSSVPEAELPVFILVQLEGEIAKEIEKKNKHAHIQR